MSALTQTVVFNDVHVGARLGCHVREVRAPLSLHSNCALPINRTCIAVRDIRMYQQRGRSSSVRKLVSKPETNGKTLDDMAKDDSFIGLVFVALGAGLVGSARQLLDVFGIEQKPARNGGQLKFPTAGTKSRKALSTPETSSTSVSDRKQFPVVTIKLSERSPPVLTEAQPDSGIPQVKSEQPSEVTQDANWTEMKSRPFQGFDVSPRVGNLDWNTFRKGADSESTLNGALVTKKSELGDNAVTNEDSSKPSSEPAMDAIDTIEPTFKTDDVKGKLESGGKASIEANPGRQSSRGTMPTTEKSDSGREVADIGRETPMSPAFAGTIPLLTGSSSGRPGSGASKGLDGRTIGLSNGVPASTGGRGANGPGDGYSGGGGGNGGSGDSGGKARYTNEDELPEPDGGRFPWVPVLLFLIAASTYPIFRYKPRQQSESEHSRLSIIEPAMEWLHCAIDNGKLKLESASSSFNTFLHDGPMNSKKEVIKIRDSKSNEDIPALESSKLSSSSAQHQELDQSHSTKNSGDKNQGRWWYALVFIGAAAYIAFLKNKDAGEDGNTATASTIIGAAASLATAAGRDQDQDAPKPDSPTPCQEFADELSHLAATFNHKDAEYANLNTHLERIEKEESKLRRDSLSDMQVVRGQIQEMKQAINESRQADVS